MTDQPVPERETDPRQPEAEQEMPEEALEEARRWKDVPAEEDPEGSTGIDAG